MHDDAANGGPPMRGGSTYTDTFIEVAPDCPARRGVAPTGRGETPTTAELEFRLLSEHPYVFTHEDLIVEVQARRRGVGPEGRSTLRAELFARPQACLRASALPKRYGWGLHFDGHGRIALYAVDSEEYRRLASDANGPGTRLKAMRNRRAG